MIINYTGKALINIDGKRILPGINKVENSWWKKIREHSSIKKMLNLDDPMLIEEQEFQEVEKVAETDPAAAGEVDFGHLKTLKIPQAKSLVESTYDLSLLEEWSKREDRNQIKGALNKQIEIMKKPLETRDRSQARQITTGRGPDVIEVAATPNASDD